MEQVGPYRLTGEIGRGGMGIVYRALHVPTGTERAVKLLASAADPELLARFRREAEVLARVGGDGVVPVHDSGTERGRAYIAMALMPGGSLRGKRLLWREAAALVSRLARVLARCHAAGIVHRDLKPDNILLDDTGTPRIADFGAAKDLSRSTLSATGTTVGTPAYMSPEQLDGRTVDERSDVYALGIILHELVTGESPFDAGGSLFAQLQEKLAGSRPRTGTALDGVIERALAPRPDSRPTAAELATALDALLAKPDAPPPRRRSGALVAVGLGVVVVALAGAILGPRAPEIAPPRPVPRPPSLPALPPVPDVSGLRMLPRPFGTPRWKHEDEVYAVALSPDGERAISASGGVVTEWDLNGRREIRSFRHVIPELAPTVRGIAWIASARIVTLADSFLWFWDLGERPVAHMKRAAEGVVPVTSFASANGRAVVLRGDGKFGVWDLEKEELLHVSERDGLVTVAISRDGRRVASGDGEGRIEVWDVTKTPRLEKTYFERGLGRARHVAFMWNGDAVVSEHGDLHVRLWDPGTGRSSVGATTLNQGCISIEPLPDGVLVAHQKRLTALEGVTSFEWQSETKERYAGFVTLSVSGDGRRALTSFGNAVEVWDLRARAALTATEGFRAGVTAIAPVRGRTFLVADRDAGVRFLSVAENGTIVESSARQMESPWTGMAVSSEKRVAWTDSSAAPFVYEIDGWRRCFKAGASHAGRPRVVAWCTDRLLASGATDGKVLLWDLSGDLRATLTASDAGGEVTSLAVLGDGMLVSATTDGTVRFWDPRRGARVGEWRGWQVAVADDGKTLAVVEGFGIRIGTLVETPREVRASNHITTLAFAPGGGALMAGTRAGVLHLWNTATGAEIARSDAFVPSCDHPTAMAFVDERHVLVGTGRGVAAVFELPRH